MKISAEEALSRLEAGNARFVAGVPGPRKPERRAELVEEQTPFAVILGCADSRVAPELVFDQDLGDLFVIRVAGNLPGPLEMGSIEFAVLTLGTPLVVVLGHGRCGAVMATIDAIRSDSRPESNLGAIVDGIRPGIESLIPGADAAPEADLVRKAVRANVHAALARLAGASPVIAERVGEGSIRVLGGEYSLDTGKVAFL